MSNGRKQGGDAVEYFVTDRIGSGTDEDPFRPRLADSSANWWWAGNTPDANVIFASPKGSPKREPFPGEDGAGPLGKQEVISRFFSTMDGPLPRLDPGKPHKSGTFTDDFNRPDEFLEDSPNWTRTGGTAGSAQVVDNELVFPIGSGGHIAMFLAPDQGSADQYAQFVWKGPDDQDSGTVPGRIYLRATDVNNGYALLQGTGLRLFRREGGGMTNIGAYETLRQLNDVIRVEAIGDSFEVFVNSISRIGPVNDSFNNTETGMGILARQLTLNAQDDWECGALGATITKRFLMNISNARSPGAPGGSVSYTITDPQGEGNIQESS